MQWMKNGALMVVLRVCERVAIQYFVTSNVGDTTSPDIQRVQRRSSFQTGSIIYYSNQ